MTKSMLTVKVAFTVGMVLILTNLSQAQRQMENLNRGTIAVRQDDGKVYVGWRMLGTDPDEPVAQSYEKNHKIP